MRFDLPFGVPLLSDADNYVYIDKTITYIFGYHGRRCNGQPSYAELEIDMPMQILLLR